MWRAIDDDRKYLDMSVLVWHKLKRRRTENRLSRQRIGSKFKPSKLKGTDRLCQVIKVYLFTTMCQLKFCRPNCTISCTSIIQCSDMGVFMYKETDILWGSVTVMVIAFDLFPNEVTTKDNPVSYYSIVFQIVPWGRTSLSSSSLLSFSQFISYGAFRTTSLLKYSGILSLQCNSTTSYGGKILRTSMFLFLDSMDISSLLYSTRWLK